MNNFDQKIFKENKNWVMERSVENCIVESSCVLILTEWDEYKEIKWDEFSDSFGTRWIFDTRLILKKYTKKSQARVLEIRIIILKNIKII